jgi:hypothetical protein
MIYSLPKPLKLIVMVLWGIDMQVTDKMIKAALKAWFGEPVNEPYDEHVDNMRFAIQAAIQAAWVKFDINNSLTFPPNGLEVMSNYGSVVKFNSHFLSFTDCRGDCEAIAWMPLPEFKEHS